MAALVQLTEGTVFAADFRVVRPLSEGGMGSVYVAEQLSTGKQRALKVMHPTLVHDPKQRQRFIQEAKIGARVESDHVVEVLSAGIEPTSGTPWLAMELLSGDTLDQRIERGGPLARGELVEVYKQLCHALTAAHDVGIVHRDLKPENIFLAVPRREGIPFVVKILDFGIAKLVAESGNTTQAIGSPLWMAPEQTNASAAITPATDVWALGLIAFVCLTGHSYWHGAHAEMPNPMTLLMEVCFDPLVPASARAAEYGVAHLLPPGFDGWFAQCVSRDVSARFKTARPARAALERLLTSGDAGDVIQPAGELPFVRSSVPIPDAPELDLPAPKPKPEPKKLADKPPEQKPESPPISARASSSAQQRIVIPPVRLSQPRVPREKEPATIVEARPFPWIKLTLGGAVVLAGLFVAQRFFWTQPGDAAQPPPVASIEEPKSKPIAKASASSAVAKCGEGMVRVAGGDNEQGKGLESFCMDVHEVSVKAYAACVQSGKCTAASTAGNWTATTADERALRNQSCNAVRADRRDHPINCVDASQAEAYCAALNKRLPTEQEWEWAARSGAAKFRYPWGSEAPDVQLCWSSFTKRTSTCAIGSFPKGGNSSGVHDLAGNVREWTSSAIAGDRAHCGGDWTDKGSTDLFKLGYCGRAPKTAKSSFLGFRCVTD